MIGATPPCGLSGSAFPRSQAFPSGPPPPRFSKGTVRSKFTVSSALGFHAFHRRALRQTTIAMSFMEFLALPSEEFNAVLESAEESSRC